MNKEGTKSKTVIKPSAPRSKMTVLPAKEDPMPVTTILELPVKDKTPIDSEMSLKPQIKVEKTLPTSPVMNSRKRIVKRMKAVGNIHRKPIKDTYDLPRTEKITVEEKITKKMNFPIDKKLYKELISLKLTDRPVVDIKQPIIHEPPVRDKEPKLEDYYTPTFGPEYSIPVDVTFAPQTNTRHYNGLRTYQLMKSWEVPD